MPRRLFSLGHRRRDVDVDAALFNSSGLTRSFLLARRHMTRGRNVVGFYSVGRMRFDTRRLKTKHSENPELQTFLKDIITSLKPGPPQAFCVVLYFKSGTLTTLPNHLSSCIIF